MDSTSILILGLAIIYVVWYSIKRDFDFRNNGNR